MVRCRVLGPIEVARADERPPPPRSLPRRQRALVARLVLARGRVVRFEALAESVWGGEDGPADARGALYTLASRLRAGLGSGLVTEPDGYSLRLPGGAVDAWAFEDGLRAARAAEPSAGLRLYDRALGFWRGRAYDEFADSFAAEEATRLEALRVAATGEREVLRR